MFLGPRRISSNCMACRGFLFERRDFRTGTRDLNRGRGPAHQRTVEDDVPSRESLAGTDRLYQMSLMLIVGEAMLVKHDVGTPVRKRAPIQLDFISEEDLPLARQGDDTTKTFGIVILLLASRRGTQALFQGRDR